MRALLAIVITAAAPRAQADSPTAWSTGVPRATQDKANALFAEANDLFAAKSHAPAAEKYRAALALWDHPLIRFNLAVTLIRLDRILEAADELEHALRFGAQPFTKDLYQQALDYQALLKGRVGDIEATCTQANVHVLLDGTPWFDCPGTKKQRVMAGVHAVVGERDGFLTSSQRLVAGGGEVTTAKIALVPLDSVVKLEYPTPRWVPWTIAGGGAAIGLGGLAFWVSGRNQMDRFATELAATCPMGCDLSTQPALADQRRSAELKGKIALGLAAGGVATLVGGVVFAILDRPRRVLPHVEVAPSHGGMAARVGWRF
jgi:hypothetical protein